MSSTTRDPEQRHPVARFTAGVHAMLDDLGDVPVWSMTSEEQRTALVQLARAESRVTSLRLRVLAGADVNDVGADEGASSTAAWVAHRTRQHRSAAHADLRLARAMESGFVATRDALAGGRLDLAQARVVVAAMHHLPVSVEQADRDRAEKHLLHLAGEHDAQALKVLGRRLLAVVDPDAADAEEGRRLQAAEEAAARATYLHLQDHGDGSHTGRFKIPDLQAAMLRKMLASLASPRRDDATRQLRARLRRPELLGQAFCQLLERYPVSRLPRAGGISASVVVLLDYDRLLSGIGAAQLDTGQRLSGGLARRLACEAGVIPVVLRHALSGPSEVLDVGRRRRFHTSAQRLALTVRDRGCTADGCDRPAAWCQAHHDVTSWADGGGTSVAQGRLLCAFHHGRAHSPGYDLSRLPDGRVRFHRRT
jgi:uncharacterized protein DUF222